MARHGLEFVGIALVLQILLPGSPLRGSGVRATSPPADEGNNRAILALVADSERVPVWFGYQDDSNRAALTLLFSGLRGVTRIEQEMTTGAIEVLVCRRDFDAFAESLRVATDSMPVFVHLACPDSEFYRAFRTRARYFPPGSFARLRYVPLDGRVTFWTAPVLVRRAQAVFSPGAGRPWSLALVALDGSRVATLARFRAVAGGVPPQINLDVRDYPSGVNMLRLMLGTRSTATKILVAR